MTLITTVLMTLPDSTRDYPYQYPLNAMVLPTALSMVSPTTPSQSICCCSIPMTLPPFCFSGGTPTQPPHLQVSFFLTLCGGQPPPYQFHAAPLQSVKQMLVCQHPRVLSALRELIVFPRVQEA